MIHGLDLKLLNEIKKYFEEIREKYSGIIDPITERVDTDVLLYQIPGGMLSNFVSQLKEQNALDRYEDVLAEVPRVRKDLGYPPPGYSHQPDCGYPGGYECSWRGKV